MRTNHALLGLGLVVATASGCGSIIGLDDYAVSEVGSQTDATGGSAGGGDGGSGGGNSDGGTSSTGGATHTGGGNATGGSGPVECEGGCDDDNECTEDTCEDGECSHTDVDVGTECAGGVCDAEQECVPCIDDEADDSDVDTGCAAGAPACDGSGADATCTGCDTAEDCDDGNDCTAEVCSETGRCVRTAIAAGHACPEGVCNGDASAAQCVACLNDDAGTTPADIDAGCAGNAGRPFCVTLDDDPVCTSCIDTNSGTAPTDLDAGCTNGMPYCIEDATGVSCRQCVDDDSGTTLSAVDSGCTGATPFCVASQCVACVNAGNCDDGFSCTVDTCSAAGACEATPDNSVCPYDAVGDKCGKCLVTGGAAGTGCGVGAAPVQSANLLVNGGFETGIAPWEESSTQGFETRADEKAHSGTWSNWLGGVEDEQSRVYQTVTLAANAVKVRASGYILREKTAQDTGGDVAWCRLYDADHATQLAEFATWTGADAAWTSFGTGATQTKPATAWAGQEVILEFGANISNQNNNYSSFFLDDLSLTEYTCN